MDLLWLGVVPLGLLMAAWPYRVALFFERTNAIGSELHWSEVEPPEWSVTLTRFVGLLAVAGGLWRTVA